MDIMDVEHALEAELGADGQGAAGDSKPAASQPEAPKDGAGDSQTAANPMDAELEVPFLGENKKAKVGEVVDLLKKSDAEVTKLREELIKAKENKSDPAEKTEDPKAKPAKVEHPEEDPEVAAAVELLKSKGFMTKEEAQKMVLDVLDAEKQIDAAVAGINNLEKEYEDTPLAFKADDLAAFMQEEGLKDPQKAFRLWKMDDLISYEKSKDKKPTQTESPGKEPIKGVGEDQPETERFSLNNPEIDSVLKEEFTKP